MSTAHRHGTWAMRRGLVALPGLLHRRGQRPPQPARELEQHARRDNIRYRRWQARGAWLVDLDLWLDFGSGVLLGIAVVAALTLTIGALT